MLRSWTLITTLLLGGCSYKAAVSTSSSSQALEQDVSQQVAMQSLDVPGTNVYDLSQLNGISSAIISQNNSNFTVNADHLVVLNTTPTAGLSTDFTVTTPSTILKLHVAISVTAQQAGEPRVWGMNQNSNTLLTGQANVASTSPMDPVTSTMSFKQIAASQAHVCGLVSDGTAYCWGEGANGRLGTNATVDTSVPLAVQTSEKFKFIAVASAGWGGDLGHSCGISLVGKVFCWGLNAHGELGNGTIIDSLVPVGILSAERFVSLSLGYSSACGVTESQQVYCWGDSSHGEIGNGTTTQANSPVLVAGTYSAIASGMDGYCGLDVSAKSIYCWGISDRGTTTYISDYTTSTVTMPNLLSPTLLDNSQLYTSIAGGGSSFCAISSANDAYCWGFEMYGRLGVGTKNFYGIYFLPTLVPGGTKFQSISIGLRSSAGIDTSGNGWVWGQNDSGELGVGFVTDGSNPIPQEGGYGIYSPYLLNDTNKFISMTVGNDFALGLRL